MESIGKIVGALLACILLFLAPIFFLAQKTELEIQSFVMTKTAYLVEHIKSDGYISPKMYEQYQRQLAKTGLLYEIKMEHQKKVYYPDEEKKEKEVQYQKHWISTYEDDILEILLEKREKYKMNRGDFFFLKVQSKSPSLAEHIRRNLFLSTGNSVIQVQFGGVIRDEIDGL